MTDRIPSAYHEAGHTVAAVLLRGECPALITIRATPGYLAACIEYDVPLDFRRHDPDRPLHADLALWADASRSIVGLLAGKAAEALVSAPVRAGGWLAEDDRPDADRVRALAMAESLERLVPLERALLRDTEAMPAGPTDDEAASALAAQLVGASAGYLVIYLQSEADRFVRRHAEAVATVAAALDRHTVIRGSDAKEYIARARGEGATSDRQPVA